jgi:hypothetical protein
VDLRHRPQGPDQHTLRARLLGRRAAARRSEGQWNLSWRSRAPASLGSGRAPILPAGAQRGWTEEPTPRRGGTANARARWRRDGTRVAGAAFEREKAA